MFILLTILQTNLKASHIIGGDISYQCLGSNQFLVTMTVFRDCGPGNAGLGNTLTIQAVNQNTGTSTNWQLTRISNTQIPFANAGICAQANLCVEEHIYQGTITLPNNTNGYDLQYNTCCRNSGVVNIANSGGASSRIHTIVPRPQLCNNSPTFSQQFSNILCVNVNGCIDLSAVDPDGDQLVYRLAQPLNSGGNLLPYSPGFNLGNTMNGNPNLTINSSTGEACVTPTQPGIFVATVEVDEIRGGIVIGQIRRDIQFVVVVCPQPIACFDLPDTICLNTPILPDLSCMPTPINSYRWAIHEMNPPGPWIPVHYTAYLPGPIAATDLRSYWNGYQAGKSYGISIDIFTPCGNATTYREVYIRDAPQAQQTVPTYPLSCTDTCVTIGHDIESTFGPGSTAFGAPFTVRWNSGATTFLQTVCPAEPTYYYATIRNRWGCPRTWRVLVDKDTCCLNPCFELPDTACAGGPIFPDLSCMQTNIDSYRWAIHEMNPPGPWIPVHYTPYLQGAVAMVDFTTLWNGFEAGKSYGISIDVFKNCGVNATTYREVYIAHKPEPLLVSIYSLTCEDSCTTIGFDFVATPGVVIGGGAPFTVVWDDGSTNDLRVVCPTGPTTYYATVTNRWGCESVWSYFVDKDTCCLDPCFVLPDTVCEGDPIIPDLSCMQNDIDTYRWAIHEMNPPGPWIPKHYTPYWNGPVAPVDFRTLWNGFEAGKSYGISIDVFKACGVNATIYREVYIKEAITEQREACVNIEGKVVLEPCGGASGPFDYVINGVATTSANSSMEVTYSPGDTYSVISYDAYGCPCTVEYTILPPPVVTLEFGIWCIGETSFDFSTLIDPACLAGIDSFTLVSLKTNTSYPLLVLDPTGGWDFITAEGIGDLACFEFVSYKDGCIVCHIQISIVFTSGCENHPPIWCGMQPRLAQPTLTNLILNIVPNPSSAIFKIIARENQEEVSFDQVKILGTDGRVVGFYENVFSQREYNVSHLPAGIYMIQVMAHHQQYTLKLVLID